MRLLYSHHSCCLIMKLTHPMSLIPLAILILIAALIVNYLVRNRQVSAPEPVSDAVEEDVSDQRTGQPNPIADIGIEILSEGADGLEAQNGDRLTVHYTGTLENGTEFDSSRGGTPFVVTLGENRVIQGWEYGLQGVKVGERRVLTIPPSLGYGDQSISSIPANSTLVFDIEVLDIERQE